MTGSDQAAPFMTVRRSIPPEVWPVEMSGSVMCPPVLVIVVAICSEGGRFAAWNTTLSGTALTLSGSWQTCRRGDVTCR
ncbi:hypothetical protein GCM10009851_26130 [Herbiconiux moechotypicola]|uniref:Uncharacterized protein n=1 Tax=Herbiconiux moechotypicola TaxID=637393 RepID=A0ABP5QLJ0_9MICO